MHRALMAFSRQGTATLPFPPSFQREAVRNSVSLFLSPFPLFSARLGLGRAVTSTLRHIFPFNQPNFFSPPFPFPLRQLGLLDSPSLSFKMKMGV